MDTKLINLRNWISFYDRLLLRSHGGKSGGPESNQSLIGSVVADPDPNPDPHVFGPPGSGSISQRHGSADPDPDPPQNVMDPQLCR
jgi:hypothetical protein